MEQSSNDERVQRYAVEIADEFAGNCGIPTPEELAERAIEVADAEQAELHAEVHRYHDRAMASEAVEAGLRGDLVCHLLETRALQAEVAELTARVARVEAVAKDMERAGDVECAELLRDALAGHEAVGG